MTTESDSCDANVSVRRRSSFLPTYFSPSEDERVDLWYAITRLRTFDDWPKYMLPRKEQLASAGFTYTGKGDKVKCFKCGILLRDWRPTDNPFKEHYLWSKNCEFLQTCFVGMKD